VYVTKLPLIRPRDAAAKEGEDGGGGLAASRGREEARVALELSFASELCKKTSHAAVAIGNTAYFPLTNGDAAEHLATVGVAVAWLWACWWLLGAAAAWLGVGLAGGLGLLAAVSAVFAGAVKLFY